MKGSKPESATRLPDPERACMIRIASAMRVRSKSIARASLEMGKALTDRGRIIFRAKGNCMYPAIRAGDVLRVAARKVADLTPGDIAVGRRPGYLFAHRVNRKGTAHGRDYVVTRPDRAKGDDPPTFDDALLGVVETIERNGRIVSPAPMDQGPGPWLALRRILVDGRQRIGESITCTLELVQGTRLYCALARFMFAALRPKIFFSVRLPTRAFGDAAFHRIAPERFSPESDWRGREVQRWTLDLHLNSSALPSAWATFARTDDADWEVAELFVSPFCRGARLDRLLIEKAETLLHLKTAA
jgi:hypothetical protein